MRSSSPHLNHRTNPAPGAGLNSDSLRILAELRGDPTTNIAEDRTDLIVDSVVGMDTDEASGDNATGDAMAGEAQESELRDDEAVAHALRDLLDPR